MLRTNLKPHFFCVRHLGTLKEPLGPSRGLKGVLIEFSLFETWMDEIQAEPTHNLGGCSLLCVGMIDHVCHPIMAAWLSSRLNDDKRGVIPTWSWTKGSSSHPYSGTYRRNKLSPPPKKKNVLELSISHVPRCK